MQLIRFLLISLIVLFVPVLVIGQEKTETDKQNTKPNEEKEVKQIEEKEPIKIDLLFNYYDQDGDHSPVTAGKGTESEQVISPALVLNIPIKKLNIFDINFGLDNISSASTDKIDGATSSPSSNDTRVHANVWYTRKFKDSVHSLGIMGGFSKEYDVSSVQGGLRYTYSSLDKNNELSTTIQYYHDQWQMIYPLELRPDIADGSLKAPKDETRDSINFSINYSRVFTPNLQGSATLDIVSQSGLLSTPFHRVVLDDNSTDLERLPDSRFRTSLGLRLNYFINDIFTTRFFYRYYSDDFGINAHTFEVEVPIKINKTFSVAPFVRYYMQTESDYFAAYGEAKSTSEYHTSDYDLSELSSNLYGVHLKYNTFWNTMFKSFAIDAFDLRVAVYDRDDGLNALSISFAISSSF